MDAARFRSALTAVKNNFVDRRSVCEACKFRVVSLALRGIPPSCTEMDAGPCPAKHALCRVHPCGVQAATRKVGKERSDPLVRRAVLMILHGALCAPAPLPPPHRCAERTLLLYLNALTAGFTGSRLRRRYASPSRFQYIGGQSPACPTDAGGPSRPASSSSRFSLKIAPIPFDITNTPTECRPP
jgi:hypothetical protein